MSVSKYLLKVWKQLWDKARSRAKENLEKQVERILATGRGALRAVLGRIPTTRLDSWEDHIREKANPIVILLKELHCIMPKP